MYQIREHKFGSDPVVTQTCQYLDNAKAAVHHYVTGYGASLRMLSILGPRGETYTLRSDLTWEVTEKIS
jgi:ATP phosphoribosyltransferase regulatory subunit HisZ